MAEGSADQQLKGIEKKLEALDRCIAAVLEKRLAEEDPRRAGILKEQVSSDGACTCCRMVPKLPSPQWHLLELPACSTWTLEDSMQQLCGATDAHNTAHCTCIAASTLQFDHLWKQKHDLDEKHTALLGKPPGV
jgi:hypothetical protein